MNFVWDCSLVIFPSTLDWSGLSQSLLLLSSACTQGFPTINLLPLVMSMRGGGALLVVRGSSSSSALDVSFYFSLTCLDFSLTSLYPDSETYQRWMSMCLFSLPSERLPSNFLIRAWPIPLHKKIQNKWCRRSEA